ncbi:unnamed protein product, partial [Prorocentrum cordatum]
PWLRARRVCRPTRSLDPLLITARRTSDTVLQMVRSGALLPVALVALSGCRALDVQKFGVERIEKFAALRAESESLRGELGAERAGTRVRADAAGSLDMLQGAEQVATRVQASLGQNLQGGAAVDSMATSSSTAEMRRLLERKIAAIAAEEAGAKTEGAAKADWIDEIVARARQAGRARLEEAKRFSKEAADRWEMAHAKQGRRRSRGDAEAKDAAVEGEATDESVRMAV